MRRMQQKEQIKEESRSGIPRRGTWHTKRPSHPYHQINGVASTPAGFQRLPSHRGSDYSHSASHYV